MKKRLSFLITLFSLSLLAGCAAAPDKTIVRQKTGSAAAYQEIMYCKKKKAPVELSTRAF